MVLVQAASGNGKNFDYDLVIIGCGVGGHGAALHAVECVSLNTTKALDFLLYGIKYIRVFDPYWEQISQASLATFKEIILVMK